MKLQSTLKHLLVFLLMFSNCKTVLANTDDIIKSLFPTSTSSIKDINGNPLALNAGLSYLSTDAKFDGVKGADYTAVIYRAAPSIGDFTCDLEVINLTTNPPKLMGQTQLATSGSLLSCTDISSIDLDGDGKPEILVGSADIRGASNPPTIFKWSGTNLVEITPQTQINGHTVSAFRSISIVQTPEGTMLVDSPDTSISSDKTTKTYSLKNGQFKRSQTFDGYYTYQKKKDQLPTQNTSDLNISEGIYTLEVKQLAGARAVRAEILLDNSITLKPQDFCSGPQPSKSNKAAWIGNDDADDKNEDHMKRCPAKKDVYAIVKVKQGSVLKVKVFGAGGSQLQVTLKKK